MTCLDSFLMLYRQLPGGFIRANHITFPILMDRGHLFGGMAEIGSCVLLFDRVGKMVHRYDFPLTGYQFEEIFEILNR